MADALPDLYDAVRLFHGCRPIDVATYYVRGLEPLDCRRADAEAYSVFSHDVFPELTAADVAEAIAEVGADGRAGRVWFCLDARELLEHCGHYLIYGSEYLCGIGASLCRIVESRHGYSADFREVLTQRGVPTLLVCDVPFTLLRQSTLPELAEALLEGVLAIQGVADTDALVAPTDISGFSTDRRIPARCIAGHRHPARIRNWLTLGGAMYRWRD